MPTEFCHPRILMRVTAAALSLLGLALLAGCPSNSSAPAQSNVSTATLSGTVHGGRPPVGSSDVYAYEVSTTAGTPPTQIGHATTDPTTGQFTMTFNPTPADGQIVYLVAVGGNAGGGGTNNAIYLMTVAGAYCSSGTGGCSFPSSVNIDELTTIASTATLYSYMSFVDCSTIPTSTQSGTCLSIPGATGLADKADTVNSLVNVSNGQASAFLSAQATGSPAYTTLEKLNTLADVLAACVNATTSTPTPCTNLFALTLNVPDTLQAAYNIAAAPTVTAKSSQIYDLLPPQQVYTPTLTAAPSAGGWTLAGESFAYVANKSGNDVSVYLVSSSVGAMEEIMNSPFAAGSAPSSVTIDPSGRFAYVTNSGGPDISAYVLDPATGAPSPITSGASACLNLSTANPNNCFATGPSPQAVAVDSTGSYAYVLTSDGVYRYSIDGTTGALTQLTPATSAGTSPQAMALLPNSAGDFLYVANSGSNDISVYQVDESSGALTEISGSPFPAGDTPKAITIAPNGQFAYVANSAGNDISAYTVDSSGALTPITGGNASPCNGTLSPNPNNCFTAGTTPVSITIDATGSYLYTANSGSDNVSGYSIDGGTGELTEIAGPPASPYTAGTTPVSVTLDPSGKFAYATNSGSNDVTAYTVDGATGALVAVNVSGSFNTGSGPWKVALSGSGRFLYVSDAGSNAVSAYTVDSSTGALVSVAGSACSGVTGVSNCFAAGTTPHGLAVDPSSKYVYVANSGSTGTSGITGYTIEGNTGALTTIASYTTGAANPESVVVDPSGSFLYVANHGSSTGTNGVTGYTITASGALSTIASYATGKTPQTVAVYPTGQYLYVTDYSSKDITGFGINGSGALAPLTGSPFATGTHPYGMTVTPNGAYAYVSTGNSINGYTVDGGSGALTAMASTYSAGTNPEGIVAGPNNSYLYSADFGGNTTNAIWSFTIGSGGALTGNSYAGATHPVHVAVNPTGTIIYVSYNASNQVWAYKVGTSGALSLLGLTSPFTAGSGPGAMKFRP